MLLLSHVNIFYVINTRKYATNINMYRVGQRNEWMNKRRMEYMKTFQYDCKQGVTDFVQTSNLCVELLNVEFSYYICRLYFEYGGYTKQLFAEID